MTMGKEGKLILILGPSGSGKGTVLAGLRKHHPHWIFPVSCTTRPKRPHEVEGEVYEFVTPEEFERRKSGGEFLEWAVVHHDYSYGTLKAPILEAMDRGEIVIREVDVQGLRSIREMIPRANLVSIFLTVPGWDTLHRRILKRASMSEEELARRYESFLKEMEWAKECDHVIESVEGETVQLIGAVERVILGAENNGA